MPGCCRCLNQTSHMAQAIEWLFFWLTDLWLVVFGQDQVAPYIGLLLGVMTLLFVRASQIWNYRQEFGRNVYHAEKLGGWLRRWAGVAVIGAAALFVVYGMRRADKLVAEQEVILSESVTEYVRSASLAGHLVIPRLALDNSLVEAGFAGQQWDLSRLGSQVGHLAGTAYPGEEGNVVLAGHVTLYEGGWGPFAQLGSLQVGDQIFLVQGSDSVVYEVTETRMVSPEDIEVVYPTADSRLTLITCANWQENGLGDGKYTQRLVVIAKQL